MSRSKVLSLPTEDVHVGDCLVWSVPDTPTPQASPAGRTDSLGRYRAPRPEVGKPLDRGYVYPARLSRSPPAAPPSGGREMRQAMTGWPRDAPASAGGEKGGATLDHYMDDAFCPHTPPSRGAGSRTPASRPPPTPASPDPRPPTSHSQRGEEGGCESRLSRASQRASSSRGGQRTPGRATPAAAEDDGDTALDAIYGWPRQVHFASPRPDSSGSAYHPDVREDYERFYPWFPSVAGDE